MKASRLSIVLLFAALLIGGCTRSIEPGSPVSDFPLAKDTEWVYTYDTYNQGASPAEIITATYQVTEKIVDTQWVPPFFIAHVEREQQLVRADPGWDSAEATSIHEWWYVVEGQEVYESRQPLDISNINTDSMTLEFDFPLVEGKSWCLFTELKGEKIQDCSSVGRVTVGPLMSYETRAGKFTECNQVTQWFNTGNILQWFCRDTGLVAEKFDHPGTRFGFQRMLVGYSNSGRGAVTTFQIIALSLALIWLLLVAVRFRRSTLVLLIGLVVIGLFTLVEYFLGNVTAADLGLARPNSWWMTILYALAGLAVMLAYSPLADRIAGRFFKQPPTLEAFKPVRRSWVSLVVGILVAWVLGGILEELIARGIVLNSIDALLAPALGTITAEIIAILVAAAGAGVLHSYQGPRAMVIIAQLSILFGILFVVSGQDLWAVMICHGLYDTIAFIRFALRKSRYSHPEGTQPE